MEKILEIFKRLTLVDFKAIFYSSQKTLHHNEHKESTRNIKRYWIFLKQSPQ